MAEAMIIHQQLEALPNKMRHTQQLFPQQFYHNGNMTNQMPNIGQNDNNNNFDGYFPGYMYNCYPCVVPPTRPNSCQELSGRNTALLSGSQQQQVLTEAMPYSQQQPVMLHNGLVPSGYISGFYSLVPIQSVLTNEMLSCQQTLVPPDPSYHHQHHPYQSSEGQGVPALFGPLIGYQLPYLAQHFQQQHYQHFTNGCNDIIDSHRKVIIMKDVSVQTEFNEKISESILLDLPNSFFIGAKDGFKNVSPSIESHPLSKGSDTHSLMKSCKIPIPKALAPPFPMGKIQSHLYHSFRASNLQPNNFNSCLSNFPLQSNFQNIKFPASTMAFQHGQSLCFSPANYNSHINMSPNMCHFSVNQNKNQLQPANLNVLINKSDADRRPKLYRKTRTDQGQRMTNPIFEIKKEFSDIVNAVGSLVAQNGSVGNSEPTSSRASSKSSDFTQNHSEEKVAVQGIRGHRNARRNFTAKSVNNSENNGKFVTQTSLFGKMQNYLPVADFSHLQFNIYNGRPLAGGELAGWSQQASYQKNHDIRSTKRKQQKRQMLANKAAEEELEEISKERDNLLRGIRTSKQMVGSNDPCMTEVLEQNQSKDDELVGDIEDSSYHKDAKDETSKFGDFDGDSRTLEFIEFVDSTDSPEVPQKTLKSIKRNFQGNNSLEENPSPLSQMSPLTFSPPLSCPNELMNCDDPATGCVMSKIHSRRFREYCSQVLDKEIDDRCVQLLQDLVKFQDQMYHIDPSKAKSKKRFVLGLREVAKHLKMGKLKCVIISPNLEQTQSKGGLDEALKSIIETCQAQEVPFIFALGRRALGRACAKLVPVSVVGIFNYEGVEENFAALKNLTQKARDAYADMVNSLKKEAALQSIPDQIDFGAGEDAETPGDLKEKCNHSSTKSVSSSSALPSTISSAPPGPPPGGFEKLFPHLGHSRTPSACSAISFVSSVLSEPISENMPQSEPEIESKVPERNAAADGDSPMECKEGEAGSKSATLADCERDFIKEKCGAQTANLECNAISGGIGTETTVDIGVCYNGSGKMNNNSEEKITSEVHRVLLLESKSILTSIHENCELEIHLDKMCPESEQECNVPNEGGEVELDGTMPDSIQPSSIVDEINSREKKWSKKKRFCDGTRRNLCFEDFNDGNDADTEEDRGGRNAETAALCGPRTSCDVKIHDGIYSSLPPLSGAIKSRRRRSKEDKSDDDKTIIVSKEDEEALVFSLENYCSVDKASTGRAAVEVILARFCTTGPGRHEGLPEEAEEEEEEERDEEEETNAHGNKRRSKEPSLPGELSLSSSTTSRIESWVAESQKALRGLSLLREEEDDDHARGSGDYDDDDGDDEKAGEKL